MGNVRETIEQAEELIEETIWDEAEVGSSDGILKRFQKAKSMLDAIEPTDEMEERDHKRVLSFALMRIDETLNNLGDTEDTMKRVEESLKYAVESGDLVQIARCRLMLGIRLLNIGRIPEAEQHFTDIITGGIDSDDKDMLQTVGWTLLVRANILKGKSLYSQALYVAEDAAGILSRVKNYAGLKQIYSLMAKLYMDVGQPAKSEEMERMSESFGQKAKELRQ